MGNAISAVLTWFMMVIVVCILILALPIWIACVMIFRDREPIRLPSIMALLALDFILLGELEKKYPTLLKWYHVWRKWWPRRRRHA